MHDDDLTDIGGLNNRPQRPSGGGNKLSSSNYLRNHVEAPEDITENSSGLTMVREEKGN